MQTPHAPTPGKEKWKGEKIEGERKRKELHFV
jgi:hypothetical protein